MKNFYQQFKYFLFYPKFNFFDYMMIWSITTLAITYSWWFIVVLIPVIFFSTKMELQVREEERDAKISNGKAE